MFRITDNITTITMTSKIRVNVLGVSYSNNSGHNIPYLVILGKPKEKTKIPIIIGSSEAQSIVIALEKIPAPRPLSHDIFTSITKEFDINIKELLIYEYNEGIFFAKMICENGDKIKEIECRPSDGIAIALRLDIPIYTTSDIYEEAGINIDSKKEMSSQNESRDDDENKPIEELNINQLRRHLNKAIEEENYELASAINERLKILSNKV